MGATGDWDLHAYFHRKWLKPTPWAQRGPPSSVSSPKGADSLSTLNIAVEANERGLVLLAPYKYVDLTGERPGTQDRQTSRHYGEQLRP